MADRFNYDVFVTRNNGYVAPATQEKIREKTLLIAGCGIGSSVAVCAARLGFENFVLVDGDVVDPHNLNRQFYDFADIGKPKVDGLKDKILRINPEAKVEAICAYLTPENTNDIVKRADIVFDTVDFLDLEAILSLHTSARDNNVELFTALSIGFGAGVLYFPAGSGMSLADVVASDVKSANESGGASYINVFEKIIGRIAAHLDAQVVEQIAKALTIMENGKPCPASQVAVGSFTIAALAVSMMHEVLEGNKDKVPCAPNMVIHSFKNHVTKLVNIAA
ncbi:MAG: ThiF family adenylyltransferase [Desulfuromonadales bacterium]